MSEDRTGRAGTDDTRADAEGRGTNIGAVEIAQEQVGDEGAPNYKTVPKKKIPKGPLDAHEHHDDARGQGAQTYEAGEANSESLEESVDTEAQTDD